MTQEIYCDENGFSGNNLIEDSQNYFIYCSVAMQEGDAFEVVKKAFRDFRLQGKELKGKYLLKSDNGRRALEFISSQVAPKAKLVFHDKIYALAGKFYEYTFEPLLAKKSSYFYSINFHKFISTLLYLSFLCDKKVMGIFLNDFQDLMREKESTNLCHPFHKERLNELPEEIRKVLEFCLLHREEILQEIVSLKEMPLANKWVLDLTQTSLFGLLSVWSETYDVMDVYCDSSKPLIENPELFRAMVGRQDKGYIKIGTKELRLTFNLKREIQCVMSEDFPGIQLADAVASVWAFVLGNPEDDWARKMKPHFTDSLAGFSVLPEIENLDLANRECIFNTLLFHELLDRSRKGKPLLKCLEPIVQRLSEMLPIIQLDLARKDLIKGKR
jgi:hypothetical protein